jgi:hypothetical protein
MNEFWFASCPLAGVPVTAENISRLFDSFPVGPSSSHHASLPDCIPLNWVSVLLSCQPPDKWMPRFGHRFFFALLALTMGEETAPLLPASRSAFKRPNEVSLLRVVLVFVLVVFPMFFLSEVELPSIEVPWGHEEYGNLCPQVGALHPQVHEELARNLSALYDSPSFVETAAGWLGGAVRIACVLIDHYWIALMSLQCQH